MADVDDDRLLDALAVALRPVASEPSMAELSALRSVVEEVGGRGARSGVRRARRWVAGVLAGGVVLSGGTAYATNAVAPRPVRSAAFALKLPVEAPDLTDAKDALADLEEELREGRRAEVAAEVEDVVEELADLSPAARRSLEPRASTLLATAAAYLADTAGSVGGDDDGSSGSGADSDDADSSGSGSGSDGSGSSSSGSGHDSDSGSGSDSSGSGSGSDSDDDSSGSGGDSDHSSGSRGDSDSSGSGSDDDSSGSGSGGGGSDDDQGGVSASGTGGHTELER